MLQQLLRSDSLVTSHGVPPASAFTISRRDGLEIVGLAETDTAVWAAAMSLASQLLVVEPSSEATVRSSSRWAIRRDTAPRTRRNGHAVLRRAGAQVAISDGTPTSASGTR